MKQNKWLVQWIQSIERPQLFWGLFFMITFGFIFLMLKDKRARDVRNFRETNNANGPLKEQIKKEPSQKKSN